MPVRWPAASASAVISAAARALSPASERLDRYPVLGCRIGGRMQAPGRFPDVLEHMDQVNDDVDGDAASGGFGADQAELVLGAVDQDHPGPLVLPVAGVGLVERGGDHVCGVVLH
jgi:hypothetical protein